MPASPLRVGGLSRADLTQPLEDAGVELNTSAETLLSDPAFDRRHNETITIVQRRVVELGLAQGARLAQILEAAKVHGLLPCPSITGPYLRLALSDQTSAPDSGLSNGHAPTGSITVASERLRAVLGYPRGFYLRVVDGQRWLRGYRCSEDHPWSADDMFAFRLP